MSFNVINKCAKEQTKRSNIFCINLSLYVFSYSMCSVDSVDHFSHNSRIRLTVLIIRKKKTNLIGFINKTVFDRNDNVINESPMIWLKMRAIRLNLSTYLKYLQDISLKVRRTRNNCNTFYKMNIILIRHWSKLV